VAQAREASFLHQEHATPTLVFQVVEPHPRSNLDATSCRVGGSTDPAIIVLVDERSIASDEVLVEFEDPGPGVTEDLGQFLHQTGNEIFGVDHERPRWTDVTAHRRDGLLTCNPRQGEDAGGCLWIEGFEQVSDDDQTRGDLTGPMTTDLATLTADLSVAIEHGLQPETPPTSGDSLEDPRSELRASNGRYDVVSGQDDLEKALALVEPDRAPTNPAAYDGDPARLDLAPVELLSMPVVAEGDVRGARSCDEQRRPFTAMGEGVPDGMGVHWFEVAEIEDVEAASTHERSGPTPVSDGSTNPVRHVPPFGRDVTTPR